MLSAHRLTKKRFGQLSALDDTSEAAHLADPHNMIVSSEALHPHLDLMAAVFRYSVHDDYLGLHRSDGYPPVKHPSPRLCIRTPCPDSLEESPDG